MNLAKLAMDMNIKKVTPDTKVPDAVKLIHQHPILQL